MARFTILVPCFSNERLLEQTLLSILSASPSDAEVVVVDRSGYRDPYGLGVSELRLVKAPARASLCDMLQLGFAEATAPIVHLIGSGLEVKSHWYEAALSWFDDDQIGCVAPACWEKADTISDELVALGVRATRKGRRVEVETRGHEGIRECHGFGVLGPAWYAGFYRLEALEDQLAFQGQYGETYADIDAAMRLRNAGYASVVEPRAQLTQLDSCELLPESSFRQGRFEWQFACDHQQSLVELNQSKRQVAHSATFVDPYRILSVAGRFAAALGSGRRAA